MGTLFASATAPLLRSPSVRITANTFESLETVPVNEILSAGFDEPFNAQDTLRAAFKQARHGSVFRSPNNDVWIYNPKAMHSGTCFTRTSSSCYETARGWWHGYRHFDALDIDGAEHWVTHVLHR